MYKMEARRLEESWVCKFMRDFSEDPEKIYIQKDQQGRITEF